MKLTKKILNILLSKFTGLVATVIIITCTQFTSVINAIIPEYKGLYTIFTPENSATLAVDTIGIGQALKYSNWLENVYTYAPADNAARKVIAILWQKFLFDQETGNFAELQNFGPSTTSYPANGLTPYYLGKIIKYIRAYKVNNQNQMKNSKTSTKDRQNLIANILLDTKENENKKHLLKKFIIALEKLKYDPNFIPEMPEIILWAFLESKLDWPEDAFEICLNEIDQNLSQKLKLNGIYTKNDFDAIKKKFESKESIDNTAKNIIKKQANTQNEYDEFTYYLIKSAKTKNTPNKVLMANLPYTDSKTGKTTPRFTTCAESSFLDCAISMLIFNQTTKSYDPNMLPEDIRNSEIFKNLLKKVFCINENSKNNENSVESIENIENIEYIPAEDINKRTQAFINLIENLTENPDNLLYKEKSIDGINYNLKSCLENFIKVLNKFLNLGFVITETKIGTEDVLKVNYKNKAQANINLTIGKDTEPVTKKDDEIIIEKDKVESWTPLFNLISERLCTEERNVRFKISTDSGFGKVETIDCNGKQYFYHTGIIKINIGYIELSLHVKDGHADVDCPARDKSELSAKYDLKNLKNELIDQLTHNIAENKNLIPLFIFLPYMQIIENNTKIDTKNKTEELLYYSFSLKDHNIKKDFLEKFFDINSKTVKSAYENNSVIKLVSKLIEILPDSDMNFITPLIKYYCGKVKPVKNTNNETFESENQDNFCWKQEIEIKINKILENAKKQQGYKDLLNPIFENIISNLNTFNGFLEKIILEIIKISDMENQKVELLATIYSSKQTTIKLLYENTNIKNSISQLITELPINNDFPSTLISYLYRHKDSDNKLEWQDEIESKITTTVIESKKHNYQNTLVNIFKEILIKKEKSENNSNCFLSKILNDITPKETENPNIKNNVIGETLLHITIANNNLDIAQIILKNQKTDVNARTRSYPKYTPLHIATNNKNIKAMELLLSHPNIRVNEKDANRNPALTCLFYKNFYDQKTAETLLSHKDIDVFDEKCNEIPLRMAIIDGNTNFIETILKNKKDLNITKLLNLVLYYNCDINKTKDMIKIILEQKNLNINEKDKDGNTLLHITIKRDQAKTNRYRCCNDEKFKQIISMLLEHQDIDVNARNKYGYTPLHLFLSDYDIMYRYLDTIKIFLKHKNIDIYAKKKILFLYFGETPADIIKKRYFGDDEKIIKELLEQKVREEKIKKLDKKIDKIKNSWFFVNC